MLYQQLNQHLGYPKGAKSLTDNSRNGSSQKTIITDTGKLDLITPRDRDSSFEPQIIKKGQTRYRALIIRL